MKKVLVIPTYWGKISNDQDVILDHPTPLETKGTLGRLLENLSTFDEIQDIPVYIIGVSNKDELNEKVEEYLKKYIEPYHEKINIKLFSYNFLSKITNMLGDHKNLAYLFNLKSYPQIRNFSLLPLIVNDVDLAIFLDDDEIIEDDDYFKKALEHFNSKNVKIHGKAGYYINEEDYKLDEDNVPSWQKPSWNKVKHMNETFENLIESDERLQKGPIALGGNMVLTNKIMRNICYDINIPRGEDIDYLFNSKIYDYNIYFDNQLKIKHLPPKHDSKEWKDARQDFIRFRNSKIKLNNIKEHSDLKQITIDDLQTYPGVFMDEDLEKRGKEYMHKLGEFYKSEEKIKSYQETKKNINILHDQSTQNIDFISLYKKQVNDWRIVVDILTD